MSQDLFHHSGSPSSTARTTSCCEPSRPVAPPLTVGRPSCGTASSYSTISTPLTTTVALTWRPIGPTSTDGTGNDTTATWRPSCTPTLSRCDDDTATGKPSEHASQRPALMPEGRTLTGKSSVRSGGLGCNEILTQRCLQVPGQLTVARRVRDGSPADAQSGIFRPRLAASAPSGVVTDAAARGRARGRSRCRPRAVAACG